MLEQILLDVKFWVLALIFFMILATILALLIVSKKRVFIKIKTNFGNVIIHFF